MKGGARTLIVTRPAAQAEGWLRELQALGVSACALPLIDIAALADASALAALRQAAADPSPWRLVMFVSANAVQHFFAARPAAAAWPAGTLAGATGPGTVAALQAAGVPAAQIEAPAAGAARLDTEALWQRLQRHDWAGRRALVVRGEDGRDWLAEALQRAGAQVQFLAGYRRALPVWDAAAQALLAQAQAAPARWLWHFSSSEAVRNLQALVPGLAWQAAAALATHERIAQAARAAGFGEVRTIAPGVAAAVAALHAFDAGRPG